MLSSGGEVLPDSVLTESVVRKADLLKIAQRFIAGFESTRHKESVKRTAGKDPRNYGKQIFSRPLHGLATVVRRLPSTEVLGYFQIVRFADETIYANAA